MERAFAAMEVWLNMARSADGRSSSGGQWKGFTSRRDRERMDELRALCDGLIIGPRTLAIDNPNVIVKASPESSPVPVTICSHTELSPELRFFHGPKRALVFSRRSNPGLPCNWIQLEDTGVAAILRELASRGMKRVLVEGGETLASAFFAADTVDRIFMTIVPWLLGGGEREDAPFPAIRYSLFECTRVDDEVFLEYRKI